MAERCRTYCATALSTPQALRIAEDHRALGWTCTTRGRRIVLTTTKDEHLSPEVALVLEQVDHRPHAESAVAWLVPEVRPLRQAEGGGQDG